MRSWIDLVSKERQIPFLDLRIQSKIFLKKCTLKVTHPKSCSVQVAGQIRTEIISSCVDLLDLGVIHACEWPLRSPTHLLSVINFKEC